MIDEEQLRHQRVLKLIQVLFGAQYKTPLYN